MITKLEMKQYVQFSDNIADRIFDFHLGNAIQFDLRPRLGDVLYNALTTAPPPELQALLTNYVKRWAALSVFLRFITEHGTNVTQFGFTTLRDPAGSFDSATEERRAVFLRAYRSDSEAAYSQMVAEIARKNYTFDGIKFTLPQNKRHSVITAVRK